MSLEIPNQWTFKSENVAQHFDQHVREQLPWYDMVSDAVVSIAKNYMPRGGVVYDFGCSTGNIGRRLTDDYLKTRGVKLIGVDNSKSMSSRYDAPGEFICEDLESFEPEPFDVGIVFLTMMFMAPSDQRAFYKRIRKRLKVGGVLICVDKAPAASGYIATVIWRMIQEAKLRGGATLEEITKKEMSLIGQQRPVGSSIYGSGTRFFQFGYFIGWIDEKID